MITMLRALMEYGSRLPLEDSLTLEGDHLRFDLHGLTLQASKEPVKLFRETRAAEIRPYTLSDHSVYVYGSSKAKKDEEAFPLFWQRVKDVLQTTEPALVAEVDRVLAQRKKWPALPAKAIEKKTRIVLTWKGTPLNELPSVAAWRTETFRARMEPSTETPTSICLLTGEPCRPARLHPKFNIMGTGTAVPIIGFQKGSTFEYRNQKQGDNFSTSPKATALYANGLNALLKDESSTAPISMSKGLTCTLVMWPGVGTSHPIVGLTTSLLHALIWPDNEEAKVLWTKIEALAAEDSTPIHAAILRGSQGRISVFNYGCFLASKLKANLLRFKEDMRHTTPWPSFTRLSQQKEPGATNTIISGYTITHLAWAVLSGASYPKALPGFFESKIKETTARSLQPWLLALNEQRIV